MEGGHGPQVSMQSSQSWQVGTCMLASVWSFRVDIVIVCTMQGKGAFARIRCFQRRMFRRPNANTTWYVQSRFRPIADDDLDLNLQSWRFHDTSWMGKNAERKLKTSSTKLTIVRSSGFCLVLSFTLIRCPGTLKRSELYHMQTHGPGLGVFGMPLEPDDLLDKKDPFEASYFAVTFISSPHRVLYAEKQNLPWKKPSSMLAPPLQCLMFTVGPCIEHLEVGLTTDQAARKLRI